METLQKEYEVQAPTFASSQNAKTQYLIDSGGGDIPGTSGCRKGFQLSYNISLNIFDKL